MTEGQQPVTDGAERDPRGDITILTYFAGLASGAVLALIGYDRAVLWLQRVLSAPERGRAPAPDTTLAQVSFAYWASWAIPFLVVTVVVLATTIWRRRPRQFGIGLVLAFTALAVATAAFYIPIDLWGIRS